MNYFEHHVGDYAEATAHLSFVEDAAYHRLIRKYYSRELPLPADIREVQRLIAARTEEERQAVETVLREFFTLELDGWHQKRCDDELSRYHDKQQKARANADARWNRERSNASACAPDAIAFDVHAKAMLASSQSPVTSKEQKQRGPSASRLPQLWQPDDECIAFCRQERPELNPVEVGKRFADYWHALPAGKGRKTDWTATWRNWVRNERPPPKPNSFESLTQTRQRTNDELTGRTRFRDDERTVDA
jgi:uncharacterized protein YdaU (DUF1376 family)